MLDHIEQRRHEKVSQRDVIFCCNCPTGIKHDNAETSSMLTQAQLQHAADTPHVKRSLPASLKQASEKAVITAAIDLQRSSQHAKRLPEVQQVSEMLTSLGYSHSLFGLVANSTRVIDLQIQSKSGVAQRLRFWQDTNMAHC